MTKERTLIMLKPAAFQRGLAEEILDRFLAAGLSIKDKMFIEYPSLDILAQHYSAEEFKNSARSFSRDRIIRYCAQGPLLLLVLEGEDAISRAREIKGHSNPQKALPGSIRSLVDDTIEAADARGEAYRDLVHTSDSEEEAQRQIGLWFGNNSLI